MVYDDMYNKAFDEWKLKKIKQYTNNHNIR